MKKKTYLALSLALLLLLASACGSSGSAGAPPYGGTPSASTPSEEYWPDAEPQEPGYADFGYAGPGSCTSRRSSSTRAGRL